MPPTAKDQPDKFPVVCLCASAGGLPAYKSILRNMSGAGMALVIVAHRAPQQRDLLPDLLTRFTEMPLVDVEEGTVLEPDRIFFMPPRVHMTTDGRCFHLASGPERPGWPVSISTFLFSLAASVGARAVVVILSGMGFDGSSALGAIKAGGGTTFAQSEAEYDSMPRNAIETGHVDFVLTAADIGAHLANMGADGAHLAQRMP